MGIYGGLSCIDDQKDIATSPMTMKTTTETGKNQKFRRQVEEEKVEALKTISFSLKKFICDLLNVFFKPIGAVILRIM